MHSMPKNTSRCQYTKREGQRCRANAMTNSRFCFFHEPSKAKERAAARRNGGIERSRRVAVFPSDTPDWSLGSAREMDDLVCEMLNKVLRGELDAKIARAAAELPRTRLGKSGCRLWARLEQVSSETDVLCAPEVEGLRG